MPSLQEMKLTFPSSTVSPVPVSDDDDLAQPPMSVFYNTEVIGNFYNNAKIKFKELWPSLKDNHPHHSSGREFTDEEISRIEAHNKDWYLWSVMFMHHGDDPSLYAKHAVDSRDQGKAKKEQQAKQVCMFVRRPHGIRAASFYSQHV